MGRLCGSGAHQPVETELSSASRTGWLVTLNVSFWIHTFIGGGIHFFLPRVCIKGGICMPKVAPALHTKPSCRMADLDILWRARPTSPTVSIGQRPRSGMSPKMQPRHSFDVNLPMGQCRTLQHAREAHHAPKQSPPSFRQETNHPPQGEGKHEKESHLAAHPMRGHRGTWHVGQPHSPP